MIIEANGNKQTKLAKIALVEDNAKAAANDDKIAAEPKTAANDDNIAEKKPAANEDAVTEEVHNSPKMGA